MNEFYLEDREYLSDPFGALLETSNRELTGTQLAKAVRNNPIYGRRLGWLSRYDEIARFLGFTNYTPGAEEFAPAVADWQAKNSLVPDGIIGPKTWARMKPLLSGGTPTPAPTTRLTAAQLAKAVRNNPIYGRRLGWLSRYDEIARFLGFTNYTPGAEEFAQAVAKWQGRNGLTVDGILGPDTWAKMRTAMGGSPGGGTTPATGPQPVPVVNTQLPAATTYHRRNATRAYGVPETIQAMQWIAREWHRRHPALTISIGDISRRGGGRFKPHVSHRVGLDVDLSLVSGGRGIHLSNPNSARWRPRVQEFVDLVRKNPVLPIKAIYYNDRAVRGVTWQSGHDNHLHIRFCMPDAYRSQIDLRRIHADRPSTPVYNCGR